MKFLCVSTPQKLINTSYFAGGGGGGGAITAAEEEELPDIGFKISLLDLGFSINKKNKFDI